MTTPQAFGKVILELRRKRRCSRKQLAKFALLKPSHLKRIELGEQQTVSWKVTSRIARAFGLKVHQVARLMEKKMELKQLKSFKPRSKSKKVKKAPAFLI